MSTQNNPIQAQLAKNEEAVLARFELAHQHIHIGDTHPGDGRAQKMQDVSITLEEVLNVLEDAGFYTETVALAVAKKRCGISAGNVSSWLHEARKEKESAEKRAAFNQSKKESRYKPQFIDPATPCAGK